MIWEFKGNPCFGRKISNWPSNTGSSGQDFLPPSFPPVHSWDCPELEERQAGEGGAWSYCSSWAAVILQPFFSIFFFFLFKTRIFFMHIHSRINKSRKHNIDMILLSNIQPLFKYHQLP